MPRTQKISACIHCQQMKLKCDTRDLFPAPCSRCAKQKLRCSVDPSFKRTAQRERINAMESELRQMKAAMETAPRSLRQNGPAESSMVAQPENLANASGDAPGAPDSSPGVVPEESEWSFTRQQIEDVEVQPSDISQLLQRFYANFDPQFPILPDLNSFASSYDSCPLLFWTIIALGAKDSEEHTHLYYSLSQIVPRLALDISLHPFQSLATIQALLLLCWWPFPFRASITSPSWTYCGLATHLALQFGLHRPHNYSDFIYQAVLDGKSLIVRQKTWLGCFITNQNLSTHIGIPATLHVDNTILTALGVRPAWLPLVLEHHLKIAYHGYQICHALGHHEMTPAGLLPNPSSAIKMFENNLSTLESQIRAELSSFAEVELLRVRLQLYSFSFTDALFESKKISEAPLQTLEILERASSTAIKLIQIATTTSEDMPFWTSNFQYSVPYAVFFHLKLSTLPENLSGDRFAARNAISQGWNLLRGDSKMEDDHMSRVCSIIEYLVRRNENVQEKGVSMMVSSRMAANIVFDAAWRAKERFSESIKSFKPLDYTFATEIENVIQFGKDFQFDTQFLESA